MRRFFRIVLAVFAMSFMGHNVSAENADSIAIEIDSILATVDSIVADSVPEWYIAPEIPLSLRAPRRATASTPCSKVAAIQTFNIDSVLTEGTYYEYDNAGRVISTTVWTYNPDGTMTGKSKQEYSFDAYGNQVSTVVYDWDNTMNIWHGVSRYEYVYDAEQRMLSNTEYAWVNYAWAADTKYTWSYDAEGREAEYYAYQRDAVTNELVPVNGFVYTWLSDTQKSLEIIYTTYSNGAWNGGTKKEWAFDAEGRQTSYTYYSTITNGNWVGSSKETWVYGGPSGQLTLHEQFGWANNDWSKTVKEETEYSGANIVRIENYTYANGVTTGTRREEYTYENNKPKQTIIYAWSNGMWIGSSNETWLYGGPSGQLTLHEKFEWSNDDWSKTLKEETEYSGANIVRIENYTYANGVPTGTKKELTTYTSGKKTQILTFAWENGDWVNSNRETWEFNGPSSKQTKHEKCEWDGSAWTIMVQENTTYNGNTTIVENYERIEGVLTGTKKESNTVVSGRPTETIIYAWDAASGDWVNNTKENWTYTSGKKTLYEKVVWENGAYVNSEKEVWAYDGNTQTLYEKYTGQNNAWVGVEKEVWGYTSGRQTLYETYEWYNNAWSVTLREKSGYDAAGNKNSIENYTGSEGVLTGTQKEEYTFNSAKEVIVTVKYKWSEGVWVGDTKNEVGYREGNTEYSEANYTWNGSAWVGTGNKTETTYELNRISEEKTYAWDLVSEYWLQVLNRVCEYDTKGRLVGDTTWRYLDGEWVNYKLKTHGYDSHDNDTLAITATWNGTDWEPSSISKGTYLYTSNGNPLLVETYTGTESQWVGEKKIVYTYDSEERLLTCWQYQWKNNRWINKTLTEKMYDNAGREILSKGSNWSNNKWVGTYKYENSYDEYGNATMQAQYTGSGGSWFGLFKSERGYDNQGRVLYSISFSWRNNTWVYRSKSEYEYDDQGNVMDRKIYSYSGGIWVGEQWNEYVFDSQNREISNKEYYWTSEAWILSVLSTKTYDELDDTKLLREINGSWNSSNGVLKSYSDNHYFYNCDPHFYTVRFVNYDGKVLANMTAQEGETPTYVGSNPTREGNAEYSYTFSGWNPELAPATSNVTYTATFTATKNTYTITWKNEDGTLIDQTTAEYGTMPTHEDASKANTAEYTYTFAGWTPGIGIVTGDATYTATYTAIKKNYTVTWQYKDGTEIDHATYAYGVIPTHADAEKAATAEWTYTFKGWTPGMGMVTGDAVYTAEFDSIKNKYTIVFQNYDETELQRSEVEYGVTPEFIGEDPTKPADAQDTYNFAGWDPQVVPVTGNATYTAQYTSTVNSYTIKFMNGDTELQSSQVAYGEMPVYEGATPTKDATAQYTYDFSGWDSDIVAVTGAKTYNAQFTSTVNSYVITFMNGEDILQTGEVAYGETPEYTGATPTKPADAQDTYTFAGWSPEIVSVTGTATYTATFTGTTNKYLITFKNGETELQSSEVEYGETPSYTGATPTKPADAQYTYTFSGWNPAIVAVTGIATYEAQFSSTINKYTIKFMNGETELQSSEVDYGTEPVYAGATPTKDATAQYSYAFTGWDKEIASVTGDETYIAQFSSTVNKYVITFMNGTTELQSSEVEYGTVPTYEGAVPTKPGDAQYTYDFLDWDEEIVAVTGAKTYTATFSQTTNKYTITFKNGEDVLQSTEVEYGETPSYTGATPTKPADAQYTYNFSGWDPQVVTVTEAKTYEAQFSSTVNKYTIKFMNGETELQSSEVEYGTEPVYAGATPTKDATAQYSYAFTGWDSEIESVTGTKTYTATFSQTTNKYTVTFMNSTDILQTGEVEYGETPVYTAATPTKDATAQYTYTFAGWDKEIASVTGDETYTAQFSSEVNSYVITFMNGTDILQTGEVAYGETPVYAGETPTKDADETYSYVFAGWDEEIAAVTGAKTYTATFSGIKSTYTITFYFGDGVTILAQMELAYGEMPEMTLEPARLSDPEFSYTFAGWEPAIAPVTADADYVAVYTATTNSYTIIFRNDDGTELQREVLEYGILPIYAGEEPTKEEDERYTYEFAGWKPAVDIAKADAIYTATYTATKKKKQGIEDVVEAGTSATKIYIEGNIYILRAGHAYAPDGTKLY